MALVPNAGDAYRNLANAIVLQAVQDYEYLISDKPMFVSKDKVSKTEIRIFAATQTFVPIDVTAILDKVDRVYKEEFRPYIRENIKGILEMSKKAKRHKDPWRWLQENSPYRCPFCKGTLRQGDARSGNRDYIVCQHCNLNMKIPKEGK